MKSYVVITENDESNWKDQTGVWYHYPPRYKKLITEGATVLYYKGKLKDSRFQAKRLTNLPHYFGVGLIGEVIQETQTKNLFAKILEFKMFNEAVLFKDENGYLEVKANSISYNYFRGNAVRSLTEVEFKNIVSKATHEEQAFFEPEAKYETAHTSNVLEGKKVVYYSTKYERNKSNRDEALRIHGYNCAVCNINFKESYGQIGEGFIHIHHIKPLFTLDEEVLINPATDLVPVCPNCHAIIHRKKGEVLSVEDLKRIYNKK